MRVEVEAAFRRARRAVARVGFAEGFAGCLLDFRRSLAQLLAKQGERAAGAALAHGLADEIADKWHGSVGGRFIEGELGEGDERAVAEPLLRVAEVCFQKPDVRQDHLRGAEADDLKADVLDEP